MSRLTTVGPGMPLPCPALFPTIKVGHFTGESRKVLALSRRSSANCDGVRWLSADLTSTESAAAVLAPERPTHVFFTAWSRQDSEEENITVNAGMLRVLLAALAGKPVAHVALMTGLKHYLGPFEAYAAGEMADTPFHEEEPRLRVRNFYYAQEDELFAAAAERGFTWSVHRAHTVIGHAVGNAMNMGLTLATQATLCRETGEAFVFPGSETQWNGLTDMTDAGLLAEHMLWASTTPGAANEAFNIVNGDVFRWRWMWQTWARVGPQALPGTGGHSTLSSRFSTATAPTNSSLRDSSSLPATEAHKSCMRTNVA